MTAPPPDPNGDELEAFGYVAPDPDEPPPLELWPAIGDIQPWTTLLLVLAWGLVFGALVLRREVGDPWALLDWGASATGLAPLDAAWRLLASTFLHAGAAHIFFNTTTMLIFGPAVERIFTRWGFLIVYVTGGGGASLASLAWRTWRHDSGLSVSVGASGAIFALGGALLAGAYRLRHQLAPGRARALGGALLFLVVQGFVSGFTRNGTDNVAHAAGILAGTVLGAAVPLNPRLSGRAPGVLPSAFGAAAAIALLGSLALALWGGLNH